MSLLISESSKGSVISHSQTSCLMNVVPKGLRSFDAGDADFFLGLLPGARDSNGLPDSVRRWKLRIEQMDGDRTFAVGLIYGPSGCGKSSLVKAGLLPRLSEEIVSIYVECTSDETEIRLLCGLRKQFPLLDQSLNCKDSMAALRRGLVLPQGKKLVIFLDQFEQWLHANEVDSDEELIQTLRQCDGGRVQCILIVRDDFWLPISRFFRELEVRLIEGKNSVLVDSFDLEHASKVLVAFGRAYGNLPLDGKQNSTDQGAFIKQAVEGLAQKNRVIAIRLALLAEMMKSKNWTPSKLHEVGDIEAVGVTFLEAMFCSATAPPAHRYHQNAARKVLNSLLPGLGTDIKGHMQSHSQLLAASGYADQPSDFEALLDLLDKEIGLISATYSQAVSSGDANVALSSSNQRYFQLTHDYLVPSLRDWLTRKQKETRKGLAELLLEDRSAVWNSRPENRQLVSLMQWIQIRCYTNPKKWTLPQCKMMSKASRVHCGRLFLAFSLMAVAAFAGFLILRSVI